MNLIERSTHLIQRLHPGAEITIALSLTSMLGSETFPYGTKSVLVTTAQDGWHLFWFRGRCLVMHEDELQCVTVGVAAIRVRALEHVGLLRLYPDLNNDFLNTINTFPYRDGEFIACCNMSEHFIDIQLAGPQMNEAQSLFLAERCIESEVFGATGPW